MGERAVSCDSRYSSNNQKGTIRLDFRNLPYRIQHYALCNSVGTPYHPLKENIEHVSRSPSSLVAFGCVCPITTSDSPRCSTKSSARAAAKFMLCSSSLVDSVAIGFSPSFALTSASTCPRNSGICVDRMGSRWSAEDPVIENWLSTE